MKYSIGVDLGGTNIAFGVVDVESFQIVCSHSLKTFSEEESAKSQSECCDTIANKIALGIRTLLDKFKLCEKDIQYIGIGSPGVMEASSGTVIYSCNLGLKNAPLVQKVKACFATQVYLENDANCAALAESLVGAAKGTKLSITITLGTGIGAGIIFEGRIFSGFNSAGAEIGHMVIAESGRSCNCGRKGCWETYASATALANAAKETDLRFEHTNLDARLVFDLSDRGNPIAQSLVNNYYHYLALGITNIINIFQPDILLVAGGVSMQGERLIAEISHRVMQESYTRDYVKLGLPQTQIKLAHYGNDAGIYGAALLGIQREKEYNFET